MAAIKGRLKRLEKKSRALLDNHGITPCWPLTHLSKMQLDDEPDRRLVEPGDTDPATYWHIRYGIAWADEDYGTIARLDRECPIPKVETDWGPPSADGSLTAREVEVLNELVVDDGGTRREREAVEAARRRLRRPGDSQLRGVHGTAHDPANTALAPSGALCP